MESWIILFKLSTLIYCCIKFVLSGADNTAFVVLFILIYAFLNMLYYVLKSMAWKIPLIILSATLLVYCRFYVNALFILLLPVNVVDIVYDVTGDLRLSVLAFLPLAVVPPQVIAEYILLSCLGILVYLLVNRAHLKANALSTQNDELRRKIEDLYSKLDRNKVIKAEIKDDGIGAFHIKKGLGLKGMEERVAGVGGKVVFDGSKGFSVITLLPIEEVGNGHQGADSR